MQYMQPKEMKILNIHSVHPYYSSMYNNFIFSEDQLKPQKFIQTRLQRASRISQQEKAKIMSNLGDRKIAYVNVKRKTDNNLYADCIRFENWDTEVEKIKGKRH